MRDGDYFEHVDARGNTRVYRAAKAYGPWWAMVPRGKSRPPDEVLQGIGPYIEVGMGLAWAHERSLQAGLDHRGVGWQPELPY